MSLPSDSARAVRRASARTRLDQLDAGHARRTAPLREALERLAALSLALSDVERAIDDAPPARRATIETNRRQLEAEEAEALAALPAIVARVEAEDFGTAASGHRLETDGPRSPPDGWVLDFEAWSKVEKAIGKEAERLCRAACKDERCPCGARNDKAWRADAYRSLRRQALAASPSAPKEGGA